MSQFNVHSSVSLDKQEQPCNLDEQERDNFFYPRKCPHFPFWLVPFPTPKSTTILMCEFCFFSNLIEFK